jgi:hypothetical protein
MSGMNGVVYTLWLVFLAIAMFQGAATGKIGQVRSKKYWTIPSWGRVVCVVLGVISSGAAIFITVRYFSPLFR